MLLGFLYIFLIAIIVLFVFLIIYYSKYQANFIYISDKPNGDNISNLSTSLLKLNYNNTEASFSPILNYRSKKIAGKFKIKLSSDQTVDIFLEVRDKGSLIGDKTRYTIWERNDYGISEISLFFNSNELNDGQSHDIEIFGRYINSDGIGKTVSVHDIKVYYY